MNVTLTEELQKFIERKVQQGAYGSPDEVIAASLAMLQAGEDEEWKGEARKKIEDGLRSARAGRVHDPAAVSAWMQERKAVWQAERGQE